MDLNGDGHDDILTGSYWPGHIYFFKGKAGGAFENGSTLRDSEGHELIASKPWKSEQDYDQESLAAAPFACDMDGDADLDLLIGNIIGMVILIPNEGTKEQPSFNATRRQYLQAGGSSIRVQGDAGPVIADWDADGLPDLLVGAGDGSVTLFRNTGTQGAPTYAAGASLLSGSTNHYGQPTPAGSAPERPGIRTKVCVTDWNRDGLLDLLVGDLWYEGPAAPALSEEQVRRRDELRKRQSELGQQMSEMYGKLGKDAGLDKEYEKLGEEARTVSQELRELDPSPVPRGSVWLYLRKGTSPGK